MQNAQCLMPNAEWPPCCRGAILRARPCFAKDRRTGAQKPLHQACRGAILRARARMEPRPDGNFKFLILNFQFFHRLPSSRKEATRERWIRRMMPTDSAITAIEISSATTKVNSR